MNPQQVPPKQVELPKVPINQKPELTPEQKKELSRKRQLMKKQFYPFLEESTKSIEDAMNFCQILSISIEQAWQQKKRKSALNSLKLEKQVDPDNEYAKKVKWALDLFKDETVHDACDLINGMHSAIGAFIKKRNMKTPLKELRDEVDLLD